MTRWSPNLRCLSFLAFLLLGSSSLSSARADDGDEFSAAIKHAVTEYESGNWAEAHTLFARAHQLHPNARTSRGLGLASFELRHYLAAIDELNAALADARKPLTSAQRREVESVLTRAEQFLAVYRVTLDPVAAELRVDSQAARLQDGQLRLDPGEYAVVASAPGREDSRVTLRAEAGTRADLPITLVARVHVPAETAALPEKRELPQRSTPAKPGHKPGMLWTGGVALALGIAFDVWSWYAFTVRVSRAEALFDAPEDDYEEERLEWKDARAPLLGSAISGAALTATGVELMLLGAPDQRLPWWSAGLGAGVGAGLATWASVDIVQGKCSNADVRVCALDAQQRERGTLVLLMSAPLFALPLTKLIRGALRKPDQADVRLTASAGGLALRGRW